VYYNVLLLDFPEVNCGDVAIRPYERSMSLHVGLFLAIGRGLMRPRRRS